MSLSAIDALKRLQAGNQRFVSDSQNQPAVSMTERRRELTQSQHPYAIVLGCADSRVPVEHIFDEGLGDLFVIRVAGNVVAPSLVGSVEYAVEHLGTRLVVVLGHSSCGAVSATIDVLSQPPADLSPNLGDIVERIRPAVAELLDTELRDDRSKLIHHAVRANVRASVGQLRSSSRVIDQLMQTDGLAVVGATYSLETGEVDFFDGLPTN